MKKLIFTLLVSLAITSLLILPCLAAEEKAAPATGKTAPKAAAGRGLAAKMSSVKTPVVKLERVEIASYWGYYLDGTLDKEGKLTAGRRGAPLVLSFVYSIHNPNHFKIMLDSLKFTVAFEGFELNTPTFFDDNYIPANTTDNFRFNATFDFNVAQGSLMVANGQRLLEMNVKAPDLLKKWWEGISDFTFPISVNGTATLVGPDGKDMIVPFEGTFPPKQ
ncbi:MAG: hypothetical protein AB1585_21570 [Thermodesulfobacteriota bacterium]